MNALVIGLDGATWNVVQPLMDRGLAPNLKRLVEGGVYGVLRSTVPPISAPSWSSIATGCNPGKHGVFDFVSYDPRSYGLTLSGGPSVRSETLWSFLSREGKRVCVINIPLTYPPQPVNGVLVSGMDTPDTDCCFTYPPEVKDELFRELGDYTIDLHLTGAGRQKDETYLADYFSDGYARFLGELDALTRTRTAVARYLLQSRDWDLFIANLDGFDRLQHYLWPQLQTALSSQAASSASLEARILSVCRSMDDAVGQLLEAVPENGTFVMVVSDHGFCGLRKHVYLNKWLEENGFLVRRKARAELFEFVLKYGPLARGARRMVRALRRRGSTKLSKFAVSIDWARTKAFQRLANGIYINLRGREKQGVVEAGLEYEQLRAELAEKLVSLVDEDTGQRVVDQVLKREEIYRGGVADNAPDLVVKFRQGYSGFRREIDVERSLVPASWKNGEHMEEGIFILCGVPALPSVEREPVADVVDVFPTVTDALGLGIPPWVDGRSLIALEGKPRSAVRPGARDEHRERSVHDAPQLSEADRRRVRERLKGLGYID